MVMTLYVCMRLPLVGRVRMRVLSGSRGDYHAAHADRVVAELPGAHAVAVGLE